MPDSHTKALTKLTTALEGPILVLGASGFIGANLLRTILLTRSDVVGTYYSGNPWRLEGLPTSNVHFCNLQDDVSVDALLQKYKPRTIFNCSAFGAYSFEKDAIHIHSINYLSIVKLLEKLKTYDIAAYIHAGSSSEYGRNAAAPDENALLEPNSHYAVSKIGASYLINYYGKMRNFPAVNLRLYSVYGAYEDSSRLIPTLCCKSLEGKLPPFAKSTTSRDFIHITDTVRAFLLAATQITPSIYGESFNIGTGLKTSLADLANIVQRLFKIQDTPLFANTEARAWDVDDWYACCKKAKQMLNFEASIPLETGLCHTQQWWHNMLKMRESSELTKKVTITSTKKSLSAIVACYKDNQAIPIMYERLTNICTKLQLDYEIIFVNDCSPDDTEDVIKRLSALDPRVTGITHTRNFGSQAAFRSGMETATKEAVVLLDGDLQDPPELIEEFVKKWRAGADIVYGRRVKREMSQGLETCYKLFYRIFDYLSEISIPKDAGDFSLIDKRAVHWLLQCQESDYFLRGLRDYIGFTQVGVDYVRPERMFGTSTNNWIKNIGWAKKGIFSFTRVPLHLLTAFGGVALCATTALAFFSIITRFFFPEATPKGITFLALLVMGFGSSILLGIGLLGEYIGKIFEETKARPAFIRKHLIQHGETITTKTQE